jgi:hypothetical protein
VVAFAGPCWGAGKYSTDTGAGSVLAFFSPGRCAPPKLPCPAAAAVAGGSGAGAAVCRVVLARHVACILPDQCCAREAQRGRVSLCLPNRYMNQATWNSPGSPGLWKQLWGGRGLEGVPHPHGAREVTVHSIGHIRSPTDCFPPLASTKYTLHARLGGSS